jgi:hypothetical protein
MGSDKSYVQTAIPVKVIIANHSKAVPPDIENYPVMFAVGYQAQAGKITFHIVYIVPITVF